MMTLQTWQSHVSQWYESGQLHKIDNLIPLVHSPPEEIWGPSITDAQSKAIACWLDGCLRINRHYVHADEAKKAYSYLNFAYAKLQSVSCHPLSEIDLKSWALKRLEHLIVLILEQCSQQGWQQELHQQIESHVQFMAKHNELTVEHEMQTKKAAI